MRILQLICMTIYQLARQVWSLPQSIIANIRQRRNESSRDVREAERLDRIRHPAKYLGKN